MKTRVLNLVALGGSFFFGIMRACRKYQILGKWFPAFPVEPQDLDELFMELGIQAELTVHPAPEFVESGFGEIIIARGVRTILN